MKDKKVQLYLFFSSLLFILGFLATPKVIFAAQVNMGVDSFTPSSVTVNVGESVTWMNTSSISHTVTADNNSYNSGNLNAGDGFIRIYNVPGTYAYYCSYHGAAGGVGMAGTVVVLADSTAPTTPGNFIASTVSSTQINLSWDASTDSVGVENYKIFRDGTAIATVLLTSFSDTGLTAGTTYSYTIKAFDAAGNASVPAIVIGTTKGSSDTVQPTVSITKPIADSNISGSVVILALTGDNVGVVGVRFVLDGANLGEEDAYSPFSITWNTATASDGPHILSAVARDAAGNTRISGSVNVTVNNSPTDNGTNTTAPAINLVISAVNVSEITYNSALITWTTNIAASSQVKYGGVVSYGLSSPQSSASTTSHSVVVTGLNPNALYHFKVVSVDTSNNSLTSQDFSFTTASKSQSDTLKQQPPEEGDDQVSLKSTVVLFYRRIRMKGKFFSLKILRLYT